MASVAARAGVEPKAGPDVVAGRAFTGAPERTAGTAIVAGRTDAGAAEAVAADDEPPSAVCVGASSSMMWSHFLQRKRVTARPCSFSSATWYFCLHFSQMKFIGRLAAWSIRAVGYARSAITRPLICSRVASSGAQRKARSQDSSAAWRKPAFS